MGFWSDSWRKIRGKPTRSEEKRQRAIAAREHEKNTNKQRRLGLAERAACKAAAFTALDWHRAAPHPGKKRTDYHPRLDDNRR